MVRSHQITEARPIGQSGANLFKSYLVWMKHYGSFTPKIISCHPSDWTAKLGAAPIASNSLQTTRSDDREQINFGVNEPLGKLNSIRMGNFFSIAHAFLERKS